MLNNLVKLIEKMKRIYNEKKFDVYTKNFNKITCLGKVNIINKNIKIGKNVILYPNVSFEGNGNIEIGDNVKIGTNTILCANQDGGIKIGENTIIAGNNYIVDSNHLTAKECVIQTQKLQSKKIEIGSDVWIGTNCSIISGTKINNGAVIGASSLVNKEIRQYAIAFGIPAKVIRERK